MKPFSTDGSSLVGGGIAAKSSSPAAAAAAQSAGSATGGPAGGGGGVAPAAAAVPAAAVAIIAAVRASGKRAMIGKVSITRPVRLRVTCRSLARRCVGPDGWTTAGASVPGLQRTGNLAA